MSEPLDYQKLAIVCWRALFRHDLSENEMVIAGTVIRLSFEIGEPCVRLTYAKELSDATGILKSAVSTTVKKLHRNRALQVSQDRCVYTFLPPSKSWPWVYEMRADARLADETERGIIWANKGEQQAEFFSPPVEQEFGEALAMERARESLLEFHNAAAARYAGGSIFPATDRLPTPAPAPHELSSREGPARPLGTAGRGETPSAASLAVRPEEASDLSAPRSFSMPCEFTNREPGSRIMNAPLRDFKDSEGAKALKPLKALRAEFTNREPLESLDPGANEEQIMAFLLVALGRPTMEKFGGWWRLRVRESRWAAINLCMELRLRLTDQHLKPLRNAGGWARDQYFKIRGEESDGLAAHTNQERQQP